MVHFTNKLCSVVIRAWLRAACALALIASLLILSSCRDADGPTVVLYASADEHFARMVIKEFEKDTGITVLLVTDSELKKTAGLVDRLRSEKDRPQADVLWSSEIFMTVSLADEGVLEAHESPTLADWPAQWRDEQRRWYGFAGRARVIVYAPDRVPPDAVPTTWMDLTNSRFSGRIVMADPRAGTTGGHLGAMEAYWAREVMPGYYRAFLEGLAENHVRLLPGGNAGVVRAVMDGEADVGMTDTDDVWAAQANGAAIAHVYARHHADADEQGGGTLLIPNTVARVKGGPNPAQAAILIDYLLSEKVERMLFESDSHNVPLGPGRAEALGDLGSYAVPDPLMIDVRIAAARRDPAVQLAMKILADRPAHSEPEPIDRQAVEAADRAEDPLADEPE